MRSNRIGAIALILLAIGFTALWLALRDEPAAPAEAEAHSDATSPAVADDREPHESDEELSSADALAPPTAREEIAPIALADPSAEASDLPASAVRGRLHDSATGEALPDFSLRFTDVASRREEVVTDAQSEFVTSSKLADGPLKIEFLDRAGRAHPAEPQTVERDSADALLDLAVASGPTFWLDVQPARTISLDRLDAMLRCAGASGRFATELEPLRSGTQGAWVRFAPIDATSSESIEVTSRDGYWRGSARVQEVRGRVARIVRVDLAPCCVLAVHVADKSGAAIEDADLFLNWTGANGKSNKTYGRSIAGGLYTFKFLAAGDGTLAARSFFHAPADAPIHLAANTTSNVEVVMEKLATAGAIRGRITSETGAYTPNVDVVLYPPQSAALNGRGPTPSRTTPEWKLVDGREVGLFGFEHLPKERYRIDVQPHEDFFQWDPRRIDLEAPSESASFVVHDGVNNAGIAFRVRDGDNGILLDDFRVTIGIRGGPSTIVSASSNQVLFHRVPLDRRVAWRIDKDEYQPAFGDDAAFLAESTQDGEHVRYADVVLDPGWGDMFRIESGRRDGPPIVGAHILLDGRDAGTSGSDGTLSASAKRKPTRVEFTYKDWIVAGTIDLSPPWARPDRRFIHVQMRAPPPKKK